MCSDRRPLSALALCLLAACYDASFNDCAIRCTEDTGCPDGFRCGGERYCRPEGAEEDTDAACGPTACQAPAQFNGAAHVLADGVVRLTDEVSGQAGSAFAACAFSLNPGASFESQFRFRISGGSDSAGADGFVFIVQNAPAGATAIGRGGGEMGYEGISPSVAVEFDTSWNLWDPSDNHVALLLNGDPTTHVVQATAPFDLNYGGVLFAWVTFDGATDLLSVYLANTPTRPATPLLMSASVDVPALVAGRAYFGFSAGTGQNTNAHDIEQWAVSIDGMSAIDP